VPIETLHETAAGFEARIGGAHVEVARAGGIKISDSRTTVSLRTRGTHAEFVGRTGGAEAKALGGVERIEVRGNSLEQSWAFAARPATRTLTLNVEVEAEGEIASRDGAFTLGKSGVVYGSATWVDAKGVRSAVAAKVVGRSIELTVAASVLDQSAYPAVLDPSISPAGALDGHVVKPATASMTQTFSNYYGGSRGKMRLTFDGTNYVAVWSDTRTFSQSLYATRIDETGKILDPTGIRVGSVLPPIQALDLFGFDPDVREFESASSSAGTLVAWIEEGGINERRLRAVRVSPEGKTIDTAPLTLANPTYEYRNANGERAWMSKPFAVQADSAGFRLAVFEPRAGGGMDLVAYRLRSAAEAGDPIVSRTVTVESIAFGPTGDSWLVGDDASALLVWGGYDVLAGGVVSPRLKVAAISTTPQPLKLYDETFDSVAVRWTGNGATVMGSSMIVGLDRAGEKTFLNYREQANGFNSFAVVGSSFLVSDGNCLYRTLDDGKREGDCISPPADAERPSGQSFGQNLAAGKTTILDSTTEGYLSLATADTFATISHPSVARAKARQANPSIATDGESYVLVWRDDEQSDVALANGGGPGVYAARLALDGTVQSGPIRISLGTLKDQQSNFGQGYLNPAPRVIFDGTKFFATWGEADPVTYFDSYYRRSPTDVVGAVLSRRGELVKEKHIVVAPLRGGADVSVSSDGVNRIVAFSDSSADFPLILGVRVSIEDDAVVDQTPFAISNPAGAFRFGPSVAFDGQRTLAVWSEVEGYSLRILGRWMPRGEVAIERPFTVYQGSVFSQRPKVASDRRHGFLVTWTDVAASNLDGDIVGKFVPSTGPIPPDSTAFKISAARTDERDQDVTLASDGSNYLVTWADNRSGHFDIFGAWVAVDEPRVRDPEGVLIAGTSSEEHRPAAAGIGGGRGIVAYQAFDDAPGMSAYQIRTKAFESGLLTSTPCSANEACATRYCVGGYCCESACNGGCGVCNDVPGECTPVAKGAACGRLNAFSCDGATTSCRESCGADSDCQPGTHCVSNVCEPWEARCVDDHTELAFGKTTDCGDFKCRGTRCLSGCGSVDDCRDGLVCDGHGACVTAPPIVQDAGCAMNPSRGSGRSAPWLIIGFGLFAASWVSRRMGRGGR